MEGVLSLKFKWLVYPEDCCSLPGAESIASIYLLVLALLIPVLADSRSVSQSHSESGHLRRSQPLAASSTVVIAIGIVIDCGLGDTSDIMARLSVLTACQTFKGLQPMSPQCQATLRIFQYIQQFTHNLPVLRISLSGIIRYGGQK